MQKAKICAVVILIALLMSRMGRAESPMIDSLMAQLDLMASAPDSAMERMGDSIASKIEANPNAVAGAIIPELNNSKLTDRQLLAYIWALSFTKDSAAVPPLIDLHQKHSSESVRFRCLSVLADIGGNRAGDYLLSRFDSESNEDTRYYLLNLLAQMQYEKALPRAAEILKVDPQKLYWQPIFIFGKMGDKGVPILLGSLGDKSKNVRMNAIVLLGQWLLSPAAAAPLKERYWQEKDRDCRGLILSAMELVSTDTALSRSFFEDVASKEKDKELAQFARESLDLLKTQRESIAQAAGPKTPSAEKFQIEWSELYKSTGLRGNYDSLAVFSTYNDEPKLKELREHILQRNSDEAMGDYMRVNNIILTNRILLGEK
ncbi:conserved exported hypothetical protein [Candidatus Zixiibacteriota bacterium]|nr:conserved exported hypothetical protein [candidate division Zixibacteria bacterium]